MLRDLLVLDIVDEVIVLLDGMKLRMTLLQQFLNIHFRKTAWDPLQPRLMSLFITIRKETHTTDTTDIARYIKLGRMFLTA
jgi:hypothetical protein